MPLRAGPAVRPPSPPLLRSRLGRRLLLLFVGCALVPTCAVALLSFLSVSRQLTRESQQRLAALAKAASRTLVDRVGFFESDLRRQAPVLLACATRARADCGAELLYAAEAVATSGPGRAHLVAGGADDAALFSALRWPRLLPGTSALLARRDSAGITRFYLTHRPEGEGQAVLIARLSGDYLWSSADADGLPGTVTLSLQDPAQGALLGPATAGDQRLSSAWPLPQTQTLQLPPWSVVLSEPQRDVVAPMRGFTHTFPLVLVAALLGVLALSVSQIRRSLIPMGELLRGTRRIAAGDFHTPVQVVSRDELEELGGAFNAMTGKLERQFQALETAAEFDRAVLSSVDTGTIAQTVLDRIPDLCPCQGVSLTVLAPEQEAAATTWLELRGAAPLRTMTAATLGSQDILQTLQQPEWLLLGEGGGPVPAYLAHLAGEGRSSAVVACPLHQGGELLGVLALGDDPARRTNEGLLYFRRLADRVA
ncbi:MAG TPA: HAMP domain-containing protein, partial [Gemmatimonadales bacterium]|nr:HAMP domain-containing protein [Gemmatimonadales bacterium]